MIRKNLFYIISSLLIVGSIFAYNYLGNDFKKISFKDRIRISEKDSSTSKFLKEKNYKVPEIKYEVPNENERAYDLEPKEFVADFDGKINKISSDDDSPYKKLHCHDSYLSELKEKSKEGYRVYDIGKSKEGHKSFFFFWIKCSSDSKIMELATAVHETVHKLTDDLDGYPQIDGSILRRISETEKMMPIYKIRHKIKDYVAENIYETYLTKKKDTTDAAVDMTLFFDEFNAFMYDVHTVTQLTKGPVNYSARDGLPMFMVSLVEYIKHVKYNDSNTWNLLNSEKGKNLIRTLWTNAEKIFNIACKYDIGFEDKSAIQYLQTKSNVEVIYSFLNQKSNITSQSCK